MSVRPSVPRTRRDVQAETTRAALVDAARRLFAERGYAATGTEDVVRAAGVGTRGALYHHFPDKESLFAAVFEVVQADLGAEVLRRIRTAEPATALETLQAIVAVLPDALADRPDAVAVFRDGPAALGRQAFREAETRYAAAALGSLLARARTEHVLVDVPLEPLTRCLVAVLDEAAVAIATSSAPTVRADWSEVLTALLAGLTRRGR